VSPQTTTPESSVKTQTTATPTTAIIATTANVVGNAVDSVKEELSTPVAVSDSSETSVSTMNSAEKPEEEKSLLSFFLIALGVGLATCLTPCVYPLIPMTVSFFIKQKNGVGKAFIYGASIIGIYVLFGTVIAATLGQAAPNFISTHWIPNLLFFAIFIIFGLSFLGLFEIQLPSKFVNNVDAQSDRGGMIGIFFMAFTLALVSFSCTGPFVGTLLGLGASGKFIKPIIGMFGFGLGLASPFVLLALSPELLKKIPKSGGWMNTIKVFFGFLELALALKFFSSVDQTYNWRILDREVFLAIWIAIFTLMGFHLLGKFQMPHDDKVEKLGVPRLIFAIIVFSFVVYLFPGLFGAPLKAMSGLLPPLETQDFVISKTSDETSNTQDPDFPKSVKYNSLFKLPHGLQGFFDYKEAVEYAKKVNKPIFIDFTGRQCGNCRKMEASVWPDPEVLKRLREDYVVVALYVDDKTELPKNEWFTSKDDGLDKTTIGDKNFDFEITKFNANAQPYYCLMNPNDDTKPLIQPRAFDQDVKAFTEFLDAGKAKFFGK
jgi:thiol:disulfide interchange protein